MHGGRECSNAGAGVHGGAPNSPASLDALSGIATSFLLSLLHKQSISRNVAMLQPGTFWTADTFTAPQCRLTRWVLRWLPSPCCHTTDRRDDLSRLDNLTDYNAHTKAAPAWIVQGGDLRHALTTREESAFTWAGPGKSIALDISRGLHFLHTSGVVHRSETCVLRICALR